ncbi:MAG: RNA polymerase sigma factor WhiG [Treponemataceae bacterium]
MDTAKFDHIPEQELWERYKKEQSADIREYFIVKYAPLTKYVAGKISNSLPNHVEFEDIVGYGVFGLLDAIDKYDPDKGVQFNTYAVNRIRGAIYDELRSIDWVPRSIRQKTRQVEETISDLEAKLGRSATNEEIAKSMGMTVADYDDLLLKISNSSIVSLTSTRYQNDTNDTTAVGDTLEAPNAYNPDVIVEQEEIKKIVIKAINELPEREKNVLIMYYYEDMTLKEIGKVLNVTESRVSQIHTSANIKLKAKLTNVTKGIM